MNDKGQYCHGNSAYNGVESGGQGPSAMIITGGRLNADAHWWYFA